MNLATWPIKLLDPSEALGCMHCAAFMTRGPALEENVLQRMFRWWNKAFVLFAFDPEALAEHFTEDAVVVANGVVRGRGLDALTTSAQTIRTHWQGVRIELPLEETYASGESVFAHCRLLMETEDQERREEAMISVKTRNGRIAFLSAISRSLG